jgi:hypothetical protein
MSRLKKRLKNRQHTLKKYRFNSENDKKKAKIFRVRVSLNIEVLYESADENV